jgi:GntR family transcriptional regulator/MocR family aminotransferase
MPRATGRVSDEARGGSELLVDAELHHGRMRHDLAGALRTAIQDGRLPAGSVLPASRRLASQLEVSRGVVSDAYDQLASEGYLTVRPRAVPVITALATAPGPAEEPAVRGWRYDFSPVTPDVALFPRRAWVRAVDRALRQAPDAALDYGDHRGRPELRTALAGYLARVRGVRAEPARIIITQGFTQALSLICQVLAATGRVTVAAESPSHPGLWETVRRAGVRLAGCPVDADGLDIAALADVRAEAVLAAPAHQFPTGAVLSASRRHALIQWAARHDGLVIEDDYDAEFRYDRAGVGAVQGLNPGRVAHVGTAAKTLAPGLRLGWVTAPAWLADSLPEAKSAADSGSPAVAQLAFAALIHSGEYERHIVRVRHAYRRRRDLLLHALGEFLPGLRPTGAAAGMQILLPLPPSTDDVAIAETARHDIRLTPLSPMHLAPSPERGLLLGFGRLSGHRIPGAIRDLATVLAETGAIRVPGTAV